MFVNIHDPSLSSLVYILKGNNNSLIEICNRSTCSDFSSMFWLIKNCFTASTHKLVNHYCPDKWKCPFGFFNTVSGKVFRFVRRWLSCQNKSPAIMISITLGLFYVLINEIYHCADVIAYIWALSKAEAGPCVLGVYGMFPVRNRLVEITWRFGIMLWFICVTVALLAWPTPLNRKSMNSKKPDPDWPKFRLPSLATQFSLLIFLPVKLNICLTYASKVWTCQGSRFEFLDIWWTCPS